LSGLWDDWRGRGKSKQEEVGVSVQTSCPRMETHGESNEERDQEEVREWADTDRLDSWYSERPAQRRGRWEGRAKNNKKGDER